MKKFLLKISIYIFSIIGVMLILGTYADGNVDDNYRHFTGPKPDNIILGDSRGLQALVPDVLDAHIKGKIFNNFSLNIADSPYGNIYFKALQRKIDPKTRDGIFILTVDPWNLSMDKSVKSEADYPEIHSPFNNMHFYDWSPNYEYLIKNYNRSWFKIYLEREQIGRSNTYLHKNGWLEVNINVNKDTVAVRAKKKVAFYKAFATSERLSPVRFTAFNKIIDFLQKKGTVYIVRIPASDGIMSIENKNFPQFNKLMENIARTKNLKYFDFSRLNEDFTYVDGNHMYKESSKVFTALISDSILADRKNLK